MPLCPLFQPVSPFPCYVLARGALGKMSGIWPALGFFFFHLLFLPPHHYNSGGKKKTCQMIISVNICQVTESPCSSVVRATLIYWMCERAAEETRGLTWYFSGWLSLPANWFQQCFFFLSFFFFPKSLIASAATHVASHHNDFIDDTGQIIFSESSCLLLCYQTARRKKV